MNIDSLKILMLLQVMQHPLFLNMCSLTLCVVCFAYFLNIVIFVIIIRANSDLQHIMPNG
jgi:hypothetical protein